MDDDKLHGEKVGISLIKTITQSDIDCPIYCVTHASEEAANYLKDYPRILIRPKKLFAPWVAEDIIRELKRLGRFINRSTVFLIYAADTNEVHVEVANWLTIARVEEVCCAVFPQERVGHRRLPVAEGPMSFAQAAQTSRYKLSLPIYPMDYPGLGGFSSRPSKPFPHEWFDAGTVFPAKPVRQLPEYNAVDVPEDFLCIIDEFIEVEPGDELIIECINHRFR